jgi:DNA-binding Lrp family transcriptional regulator
LARICGVSSTAAIRRYSRLRENGVIVGEHMHLNPLSLGYDSIAEVGILTDLENLTKVADMLKTKLSIRLVNSALGKYCI